MTERLETQGLMICLGLEYLFFIKSYAVSWFCEGTTFYIDLDMPKRNCSILYFLRFFIVEKEEGALDKVPRKVKKQIHEVRKKW